MDDNQLKLPQKTVVAIVVGFVLVVSAGFGIHFSFKPKITAAENRIQADSRRLDVFKKLYPVYNKILGIYDKQKKLDLLPYPVQSVPERDISSFGDRIETLCEQTGMHFISAVPMPESIESGNERILVETVVRGDFMLFRNFLIKLFQMPSLARIGQIQIQAIPEGREYALRLWVHFT